MDKTNTFEVIKDDGYQGLSDGVRQDEVLEMQGIQARWRNLELSESHLKDYLHLTLRPNYSDQKNEIEHLVNEMLLTRRLLEENRVKIGIALTGLLKKDAFKWREDAQKAFEALKTVMTRVPILAMLDFSQPLDVEADALSVGS
ncbi:Transposon Ty3-I Gag-Pol polyprotein [Senna tora]|uniref:Transposon Ty3-I Gag-Pol polyprotein n=1 Tax=Senna tora TaxID=362788 RepID=A0A834WNY0_9FABA|nr:Transposon Ty3-I Gag-Pol polyprotein [Senna tora]